LISTVFYKYRSFFFELKKVLITSWFENINGKLYRHLIAAQLIGARIPKLEDFDNDGDLDIFLTVAENSGPEPEDEVMLFENLDGTNFINWRLNDNVNYAADIELGDMDGDGDVDALVSARDANDLLFMRNDGFQANWATDTIEQNANAPLGLDLGDMDGDNDLDVVLCSFGDAKVYWYRNNGTASFTRQVVDPNLPDPRETEIADLNGDNINDVVVVSTDASHSVAVYLADGSGGFNRDIVYTGKSSRDIEIGDWDGDGDLDIVVSFYENVPSNPVDILLLTNNGTGNFSSTELVTIAERVVGISLNDIDNDGDLDVIMGYDARNSTQPKLVSVAINTNGVISEIISLSDLEGGFVAGFDFGDIDNDNKNEIVYADFNRDDLVIIDFDFTTGLEEIVQKLVTNISVFPNPSSNLINIQSNNSDIKLESWLMMNSIGQNILGGRMKGLSSQIYIEKLSAGI
jgi:hypothetical protein